MYIASSKSVPDYKGIVEVTEKTGLSHVGYCKYQFKAELNLVNKLIQQKCASQTWNTDDEDTRNKDLGKS